MINKILSFLLRFYRPEKIQIQDQSEPENPCLKWTEHPQVLQVESSTLESKEIFDFTLKQWESAKWESLSNLEIDKIKTHPQRARLALLAAAGKLQRGELNSTREIITTARQWGASRELTARMLLSGAHETLGRASALAGDRNRALKNFKSSVALGSPESNPEDLLKCRPIESTKSVRISNAAEASMMDSGNEINISPHLRHLGAPNNFNPDFPEAENENPINGRAVASKILEYGSSIFLFHYRPDSKGDVGVIKQIFEEKQYEFGWLPQGKLVYKLHQQILSSNKKPLIIDGGANIGASCIWLQIKFPGAAILAVEPSEDNCELITRNCHGNDVWLYYGALADKPRTLTLEDPRESDWGFRVGEKGESKVPCQGIADILSHMDSEIYDPFILKLDIEGGEALVFEGECTWMELFALIVVELHDWMLPNQGTSTNFIKAVSRHGFEVITRGENVFCFNPKIYLS